MSNLALSSYTVGGNNSGNPWSSGDVDKLEFSTSDFNKIVEACRFFYKKDPLAASTINKLVEIGINDLIFSSNGLSPNEFRVFTGIKDQILEFAEIMALEYLISGLVAPEIKFARVGKDELEEIGVKKYSSLVLPVSMWLRDPSTIKIKQTVLSSEPSYFYRVPQHIISFIENKGKYGDGQEDKQLWEELKTVYPDFISAILSGQRELLLENDLIFRRKPQVNDPYPLPYLYPALENLRHKRNLRRMDYSIASRVISAIQIFTLGSDTFPVTLEDQDEQFEALKAQIQQREYGYMDIERVFQLYANHTLKVTWSYPDTTALLNEQKYSSINQDIIYGLGFPQILITGESSRTGTSDPQYAMMSPSKTMENFRRKTLKVVRYIVNQIAVQNNFKATPTVKYKPLRLFDYQTLLKTLADLYASGNVSRSTYSEELGYDWKDETNLREEEQKILEEKGLGGFAEKPFSNQPGEPNTTSKDTSKDTPKDKKASNPGNKVTKPSDINNTSNNQNGKN